jgi:hypothetical protein
MGGGKKPATVELINAEECVLIASPLFSAALFVFPTSRRLIETFSVFIGRPYRVCPIPEPQE